MLNITSKIRYGLRSLVSLAEQENSKPVSIAEIAEKQKIPVKYLENIFQLLKKNNIVKSTRGAEGGYELLKEPGKITLYEIFSAIEGPLFVTECANIEYCCENMENCGVNNLWKDFQLYIENYLKRKTLEGIIAKNRKEKKAV